MGKVNTSWRRARKSTDQKCYHKNWINKKIGCVIREQADNRYYLFSKVLPPAAIRRCLDKQPHSTLSSLETGRKFARDGNLALQKVIREEKVLSGFKGSMLGRQEMLFPDFLRAVACKLGLKEAKLAPHDKFIKHEYYLEVFR